MKKSQLQHLHCGAGAMLKEIGYEKITRLNASGHSLASRLFAGAREDIPAAHPQDRSADRG